MNHYGKTGGKQGTRILYADLFSGGLRIQRLSGRVRPYFNAGISGRGDTWLL